MKPFIAMPEPGAPLDFSTIDTALYPLGFPHIGEVWEITWGPGERRPLLILNMYNEWHWEALDIEDGTMRYPSVECWVRRNVSSYKPVRLL